MIEKNYRYEIVYGGQMICYTDSYEKMIDFVENGLKERVYSQSTHENIVNNVKSEFKALKDDPYQSNKSYQYQGIEFKRTVTEVNNSRKGIPLYTLKLGQKVMNYSENKQEILEAMINLAKFTNPKTSDWDLKDFTEEFEINAENQTYYEQSFEKLTLTKITQQ